MLADQTSVRARKNDALIPEKLIYLVHFLELTAQPDKIPEETWSALKAALTNPNTHQSKPLNIVFGKLAEALNGMVTSSFESPSMENEALSKQFFDTCVCSTASFTGASS